MRQAQIFSGSSHPILAESICQWLGTRAGQADLGKFANGETSVSIKTSIRNQDVFIIQSGSSKMNDSVIELLIMCSACKGGSAKSITAVMPYFPYSRQSKKKSHRGAITARMIANLLHVAGVSHVITIDLHSSQMQGFFKCPVDNLVAEPILANWIKRNVPDWKQGVVMSKNPGGTRRVTSLADALELDFAIITTDTRIRSYEGSVNGGTSIPDENEQIATAEGTNADSNLNSTNNSTPATPSSPRPEAFRRRTMQASDIRKSHFSHRIQAAAAATSPSRPPHTKDFASLARVQTEPAPEIDYDDEGFNDERARNVTTARVRGGHVVDDADDADDLQSTGTFSPPHSSRFRPIDHSLNDDTDTMSQSILSISSLRLPHLDSEQHALGGSMDAAASDEEEEEGLRHPDLETMVTLVGNVRDRPVFIVDDMLDKAGSWVAAAETAVKKGGATKVVCMATHGLFGDDALRELEACPSIDRVVVTDSFPIGNKGLGIKKLEVITVAPMVSEAIRRFHHGESMGTLYSAYVH